VNTNSDSLVPPRSPRRRRPSGSGIFDWQEIFSDTETSSDSPRFQKPPLEQAKKDSGIHLDEQLEKVDLID
jgi:hypothetical protein